jgi:ABC-type Fe3+-hydroxamate transport system substrate-binding protein
VALPPSAPGRPRRVVSLVPSITETLIGWGIEPVAVTRFCPAPDLPKVGGTKNPDVPAIVALAPDLVVMDKQENRVEDAEALGGAGISVHVTDVCALSDVESTLRDLAESLGIDRPSEGPTAAVSATPIAAASVWVPIWRRPWMSIGGATYGSSLLEAAGFANVLDRLDDPYPESDLEAVAAYRPDYVLAPSEPYPFSERHRAELEAVAPVVFVDGQDLFWWGIRTPGALDRLRALASDLRPD